MSKQYWGFRIDATKIDFFRRELQQGRLRQGWGWDVGQDLRSLTVDKGAKRNQAIFNKVKKGDLLLIPRLPTWGEVALVEATTDFKEGYRFERDPYLKDFGHIFPAKLIKSFARNNENISGAMRGALKQVQRFWSLNSLTDEIENLVKIDTAQLVTSQTLTGRFNSVLTDAFSKSFSADIFASEIYELMTSSFKNEEWEYALVEGLRKIYPAPFEVTREGGIREKKHGTDILIKFPGFMESVFGIAIQVKDYKGQVGLAPVHQLNKSSYWEESMGIKIVQKILLITSSKKEHNLELSIACEENNIDVIYAEDLKVLLSEIGSVYINSNVQKF